MRKFEKYSISLIFFLATFHNIRAQDKVIIKGVISDNETNQGIPYVNVSVRGTNWGDMSDENGYYELTLPCGQYEIIFSMIGYKTLCQMVHLKDSYGLELNVSLLPAALYMPGVTIIASKTMKQKQNESVSSIAFKTKKIKDLPFNLNDINRTLQTLPGVTSNNEKSSEFNVRGGSFDENLVQVDGVTIYRPFHLKEAPNASVSILNMDLMEQVNFFTGGFSAKYGDKMSAVLDISYRNGSHRTVQSQVEIGVLKATALLEGISGKKGSWILGCNKSYFGPAIRIMERYFPDFYELNGVPKFYDLQGKVKYGLSSKHEWSLLFLMSGDTYHETPANEYNVFRYDYNSYYTMMDTDNNSLMNGHYRNRLLALKSTDWFGNNLFSETTLSYYDELEDFYACSEYVIANKYYDSANKYLGFSNYKNDYRLVTDVDIKTLELKNDLTYKMGPFHELEMGLSLQQIHYLYHRNDFSQRIAYYNIQNYPDTSKIDTIYYDDNYDDRVHLKASTHKIAGYLQDSWQIGQHVFANVGFRIDYFDFNKNLNFSPRVSFSYTLGDGSVFKVAWGHYYQSPIYDEFKFTKACPENTQNQKAVHYIAGYQRAINEIFEIGIDGYYKDYRNLISYYLRSGRKFSTQENDAVGFARGVDVQVKYSLDRISGWLSYGLLMAKEDVIKDMRGFYPRATDQRHSLSAVVDWNITDRWRIYGKYLYGSGFPYTPWIFDVSSLRFVEGAKNSEFLPAYSRVDLRVTRDFNLHWGQINAYIEIINLLNHKNVFIYHHYGLDQYGNTTKEAKLLLPRLPNFGIRVSF